MTKMKKSVNEFGYFCNKMDNALLNRKTMIEQTTFKGRTLSDDERES